MDDNGIIELYHSREERAIEESDRKYGRYCKSIAFHIVYSNEDADECVSDTWLRAWNAMPPERPKILKTFLGKITRNLAIDRYRKSGAKMRGGGQAALVLEELENCIPSRDFADDVVDEMTLSGLINEFLGTLPPGQRIVFVQRYWYMLPVKQIAAEQGMTEGNVKTMLSRMRSKLKDVLAGEGIAV